MKCEEVTHEAILQAHREATWKTISQLKSTVLVIHDATELDYTTHRSLDDLGQIGNGHRRGYVAQNSLAVDPKTRQVLGLLNQVLHHRATVANGETRSRNENVNLARACFGSRERIPCQRTSS